MKNNNAFTLIELLAVIIVLSLISALVVPVIIKTIETNKEKALSVQIKSIENIINNWIVSNEEEAYYTFTCAGTCKSEITLFRLINDGYLSDKDIKDPTTGKQMRYIFEIEWDAKNEQFKITSTSEI